jgi:methionyl-tRNA formyltransferase
MMNFHPSLLPLLRGPSPIPTAIKNGYGETGVTIIQISENMDAGDILKQEVVKLNGDETTPFLSEELAHLGSSMITGVVQDAITGKLNPKPQDESKTTYCKLIKKSDGEVSFAEQSATEIAQMARAYTPWPGIYTNWNGKKIDLFEVSTLKKVRPFSDEKGLTFKAGRVDIFEKKIAIGTTEGVVLIGSLKIEGKNKITGEQFACGYPDFIGSILN